MAGLYTRRNPPLNGKDELARASSKGTRIIAVSHTPSLAPAQAFAPAPASALGLLERYTDKDLQRLIKLLLESFVKSQEHGQLYANSIPCKQPLKTCFSNLYHGNS